MEGAVSFAAADLGMFRTILRAKSSIACETWDLSRVVLQLILISQAEPLKYESVNHLGMLKGIWGILYLLGSEQIIDNGSFALWRSGLLSGDPLLLPLLNHLHVETTYFPFPSVANATSSRQASEESAM